MVVRMISLAALTAAAPLAHAAAQDADALAACVAIEDSAKRLACFDEAAAKAKANAPAVNAAPEPKPEEVFGLSNRAVEAMKAQEAAPAETVSKREDNERRFGLRLPFFSGGETQDPLTAEKLVTPEERAADPDRVNEIQSEIVRIKELAYGELRFYLANGQVWEQLGTQGRMRPGDGVGDIAHVSRMSFGSFKLRVNGRGGAIKVKRIR